MLTLANRSFNWSRLYPLRRAERHTGATVGALDGIDVELRDFIKASGTRSGVPEEYLDGVGIGRRQQGGMENEWLRSPRPSNQGSR
jgi:hypothetical protein